MPPIRLLLCDDTADLLTLFELELSFHPEIEIVGTARDGAAAVELAARTKPDVVLLDLAMPVMDGLEALREIREATPVSNVVILSGFDGAINASRAQELGAHGYVQKGAEMGTIVDAVKRAARRPSFGAQATS
jgi:DNA-binding NarL/FixJ family response regulator